MSHIETGVLHKHVSKRPENWKIDPKTVSTAATKVAIPVKAVKTRRQILSTSELELELPFESKCNGRHTLRNGRSKRARMRVTRMSHVYVVM